MGQRRPLRLHHPHGLKMNLSHKYALAEQIGREINAGMDKFIAKAKLIEIGFYDIWFERRDPGPLVIVAWLDGVRFEVGGNEA